MQTDPIACVTSVPYSGRAFVTASGSRDGTGDRCSSHHTQGVCMISKIHTRAAAITAVVGTLVLIGACSSGSSSTAPGNGTMVVQLTDAPFAFDSVKSVDVFVLRVDGKQADGDSTDAAKGAGEDSSSADGWTTLATPNKSINLLALQNGVTMTIGQLDLPAGTYRGFRLVIDPSRSSITLKNGQVLTTTSPPSVSFPSGSHSGIKIELAQPVTISTSGTVTLVVDFDLANSFALRGNSLSLNGLIFKPVVRGTEK